jgi:hypothetical protein
MSKPLTWFQLVKFRDAILAGKSHPQKSPFSVPVPEIDQRFFSTGSDRDTTAQ